jgi:thioredoxin 1
MMQYVSKALLVAMVSGVIGAMHLRAEIVSIVDMPHFEQYVLRNERPVMVKCFAPWCGMCAMSKPFFESLAVNPALKERMAFAQVEIEKFPDLSARYEIVGVPAFLYINHGAVKGRIDGFDPKSFAQECRALIRAQFGLEYEPDAAAPVIAAACDAAANPDNGICMVQSVQVAMGARIHATWREWQERIREVVSTMASRVHAYFAA